MKLDKYKLELAMADKCYSKTRLVANAGICYSSLIKLLNGRMKLTPQTLGKIAKKPHVTFCYIGIERRDINVKQKI